MEAPVLPVTRAVLATVWWGTQRAGACWMDPGPRLLQHVVSGAVASRWAFMVSVT